LNFNSICAGFIGGIICGAIFIIGGARFFFPKFSKILQKEKLKDLSFYGRLTK
jgi:hypothetical protein